MEERNMHHTPQSTMWPLMKLRKQFLYLSPTSAHVVWLYPLHSSSPIEVTTCIQYVGTTNPTD